MNANTEPRGSISAGIVTGLVMVIAGGLIFAGSGFGYRDHRWSMAVAVDLFQSGAIIAIAGMLICGISLAITRQKHRKKDLVTATVGILMGLMVSVVFVYFYTAARFDPPIHDITTDPINPPKFQVIRSLRKNGSNPCKYGGDKVAHMQEKAYPYVKPLVLNVSFESAFHKALFVARKMKSWKIVNSNASAGKIEATVTVPWFGFKDDVVVRISSIDPSRSKIDIRSESRTGVNDLGINAHRIYTYLTRVRKEKE